MATAGARIRPMGDDDVVAAERLSDDAFADLDERTSGGSTPARRRPEARSAAWVRRTRGFLRTDPAGCWVAEDPDGALAGFATSVVREGTWILATFTVRADLLGLGLGRALLAAAGEHGRGRLRGMLASSSDPRAVRSYRRVGFDLHPQMVLSGVVDRAAIPVVEKVRDGSLADRDLMDSVDRRCRDAAHGPDHEGLVADLRLLVAETATAQGYVYFDDHGVALLAATDRRTATRLLWAALADAAGDAGGVVSVPHVTGANQWALDVGFAARLSLRTEGYLGLRGIRRPPAPYLHHGSVL